jgi:hypothetical protein
VKAWYAVAVLAATVMLALSTSPVSAEPRQQVCIDSSQTQIPAGDVQKVATAIQIQIDRDFSPHWGIYADIVAKCDPASPAWRVYLDPGDNPRFYGYHDEKDGVPYAMVYTGDPSVPWSSIVSHEVLEMLVDPGLDGKIKVIQRPDGRYVVLEIGDAAANSGGYTINDVVVSDFLTPDWFKTTGTGPYDMQWLIDQPFTDLSGRTYVLSASDDMKDFNVVVLPDSLH